MLEQQNTDYAHLHVDMYTFQPLEGERGEWLNEPPKRFNNVCEMDFMRTTLNGNPIPYFNGYAWRTPPHRDGECEQWRPRAHNDGSGASDA